MSGRRGLEIVFFQFIIDGVIVGKIYPVGD
jgi:hypothetical protein